MNKKLKNVNSIFIRLLNKNWNKNRNKKIN